MDIKRILTSAIGLPVVAIFLAFCNVHIISIVIMLIAIICINEYYNVIEKVCHPIKWIGYLSTIIISIVSFFSIEVTTKYIIFGIPILILILFLHIIISNLKITFKDVAYTFLGIMYITFFMMFLSLITTQENGRIILAYTFIIAWVTDIFAYLIGKNFGKHFFSKVSPKKTIEGCIGGAVGATIIGLIYVIIANNYWGFNLELPYGVIILITLVFSIISQIGDFVASSIKRFADSKDYGSMLPGHGGMLDRIDSLIFIAPFVYMFFSIV